jgi:hypothetical protein
MFTRTLSIVALGAVAFGFVAAQQADPNRKQPPAQKPPEMSPEEQKMMQDAMPGPIHEHMKKCVGEFTTKSKMSGPGMPPEETVGSAKITMSLDGRFLVTEEEGTMMGMPVQSRKIAGYNNSGKQFEAVWMYTMSTGMLMMTGASDDNGKTINWTGKYKEADGEHTLMVTTTHIDENTFVEKLHHADGAGDGPVMETTFTRKK